MQQAYTRSTYLLVYSKYQECSRCPLTRAAVGRGLFGFGGGGVLVRWSWRGWRVMAPCLGAQMEDA